MRERKPHNLDEQAFTNQPKNVVVITAVNMSCHFICVLPVINKGKEKGKNILL